MKPKIIVVCIAVTLVEVVLVLLVAHWLFGLFDYLTGVKPFTIWPW